MYILSTWNPLSEYSLQADSCAHSAPLGDKVREIFNAMHMRTKEMFCYLRYFNILEHTTKRQAALTVITDALNAKKERMKQSHTSFFCLLAANEVFIKPPWLQRASQQYEPSYR